MFGYGANKQSWTLSFCLSPYHHHPHHPQPPNPQEGSVLQLMQPVAQIS